MFQGPCEEHGAGAGGCGLKDAWQIRTGRGRVVDDGGPWANQRRGERGVNRDEPSLRGADRRVDEGGDQGAAQATTPEAAGPFHPQNTRASEGRARG